MGGTGSETWRAKNRTIGTMWRLKLVMSGVTVRSNQNQDSDCGKEDVPQFQPFARPLIDWVTDR